MRLAHRLRTLSIRDKIVAAFLGILAIGVVLGAIVQAGLQSAIEANQDVRLEEEELASANLLIKQLVDMQTGVRGFVITGRDEFLDSYNSALGPFDSTFTKLIGQESDEPTALALLEEIGIRARAWYGDWLPRQIELRRQSPEQAAALVASGQGKAQLDAIRALFDEYTRFIEGEIRTRSEKVAATDQFKGAMTNLGQEVAYLDLPEFKAFWEADAKRVEEAVRAVGKVDG